jgi:hypothetical protein
LKIRWEIDLRRKLVQNGVCAYFNMPVKASAFLTDTDNIITAWAYSCFIIAMFRISYVQMGETRNAYRLLMGKPEGKRPLGRPRRRGVDNIKIDLREIGWDGMDWVDLAQDRDQWRALVNTAMNLRTP